MRFLVFKVSRERKKRNDEYLTLHLRRRDSLVEEVKREPRLIAGTNL